MDSTRNLALLKDYQAYLRVEKGLRPLTCEAYLGDLRTFAEFIEGRNGVLLMAVQEDVAAFLEHLRNHGIDSRSSARKLSCLRGFYKWLLLDRRTHHDPTVNIESPKAWKVLPKSLAEPEVAEMLERAGMAATHPQAQATALRDRAILELLYAGGLRVSEVTALSTGDLALDSGRVHVRGKGDKERIVPLGRAALAALETYLREGRPHLARISNKSKPNACAAGRFASRSGATVSLAARNAADAPVGLARGEDGKHGRQPAPATPQLRDAHGGARRRSAQRAIDSGSRRHLYYSGLHASGAGTAEGRASHASSPRGVEAGDCAIRSAFACGANEEQAGIAAAKAVRSAKMDKEPA